LTIKDLFIVDSTTIRLFTEILKGVGRNPKNDGKKKGGMKVHMLIDAHQSIAKFVKITEAKMHDKQFLQFLLLPEYSTIVFDKAYNHYSQFAKWTLDKIYFVTRQKSNAIYQVIETMVNTASIKNKAMVYREEIIEVSYKVENEIRTQRLKRVCYRDEKNRHFVFITNNLTLDATEIALIYKKRWGIELLFKKMKQNFQLHYFYGENENAIRTQVWCTLIAQLLLTVIQTKMGTKKAFSAVATLIRIHLISMLDVIELLRSNLREWRKERPIPVPDLFSI
jgi:IS4 transposase